MRSISSRVMLFGLIACFGLAGCSRSNTAEMPTKVVPRPMDGLKVGQPSAAGGAPTDASNGGASTEAPDPGSP